MLHNFSIIIILLIILSFSACKTDGDNDNNNDGDTEYSDGDVSVLDGDTDDEIDGDVSVFDGDTDEMVDGDVSVLDGDTDDEIDGDVSVFDGDTDDMVDGDVSVLDGDTDDMVDGDVDDDLDGETCYIGCEEEIWCPEMRTCDLREDGWPGYDSLPRNVIDAYKPDCNGECNDYCMCGCEYTVVEECELYCDIETATCATEYPSDPAMWKGLPCNEMKFYCMDDKYILECDEVNDIYVVNSCDGECSYGQCNPENGCETTEIRPTGSQCYREEGGRGHCLPDGRCEEVGASWENQACDETFSLCMNEYIREDENSASYYTFHVVCNETDGHFEVTTCGPTEYCKGFNCDDPNNLCSVTYDAEGRYCRTETNSEGKCDGNGKCIAE